MTKGNSDPNRIKSAWREAKELIWARRGRLMLGLALIGVNRGAGIVLPATSKFVIDEVLPQGRADLLALTALVVGAATFTQAMSTFALNLVLGITAQRSVTEMRLRIEQHITRLPVSYFDKHKAGELISRVMTDAEGIRNLIGTGLVQFIGGILTATIAMWVLVVLNLRLTFIITVVMAIFGVAMAIAFRMLRPLFRERGKITADVTGRLNETLGGIHTVKAYRAEKREDLIFAAGSHRLFRNVAQSMRAFSGTMAFSTAAFGVIAIIMIFFGGQSILEGEMTLGDFIMFSIFTALVAGPLVQIASIGTQLSEAFAGLDRIRDIMAIATEDEGDEDREEPGDIEGNVEFRDVEFEYDPGVPVLKGISFTAKAGSTTALVGSSGSGKSTLSNLVMAFIRPTSGAVLIDGRDLAGLRLGSYRALFGVVMQDNFLFDGTIAENIAYGAPRASQAAIAEAARVAHCDEFIEKFELGFETVIGERGVRLSGGQRQRIAIARAILADPKILILDEATSSLDSESEALIQDGLDSLRRGRTTFVIAHRLSTIRSADQILVLEDGCIVEQGNHNELYAAGGRYRHLHDKQNRFEQNLFINPGEDFSPTSETGPATEHPVQIRQL